MKRKLLPLLVLVITLLTPATANAQSSIISPDLSLILDLNRPVIETETKLPEILEVKEIKPEVKTVGPIEHIVNDGDNLSKIAIKYNVDWQRLWAKNTQLTHPDILNVGETIKIPLETEQLAREVPVSVQVPIITPNIAKTPPAPLKTAKSFDASNTYSYGYCTWYVKSRRGSSLPNGLGNANTWYSRARAMGLSVGSTPRPGAVGATTRGSLGHVIYVESVNSDGTINISEMNYKGFNVKSSRTAKATEFNYIY